MRLLVVASLYMCVMAWLSVTDKLLHGTRLSNVEPVAVTSLGRTRALLWVGIAKSGQTTMEQQYNRI